MIRAGNGAGRRPHSGPGGGGFAGGRPRRLRRRRWRSSWPPGLRASPSCASGCVPCSPPENTKIAVPANGRLGADTGRSRQYSGTEQLAEKQQHQGNCCDNPAAQQHRAWYAGQARAATGADPAPRDKPTGTVSLSISVGHADVSVVDHTPEELANLTLTELRLEWASGIGPEGTFASFRLSVQNLQLDDQLPYSRCWLYSGWVVELLCQISSSRSVYASSVRRCPPSLSGMLWFQCCLTCSYIRPQLCTAGCRFPVILAGTDTEIRTGEEVSVEGEAPPLLKFTIVSQPGLPRRQIYYPYISFRLSRPLQVSTGLFWCPQ